MASSLSLYLMSGLYVFAGVMHFVKPRLYRKIVPPYLPFTNQLVWLSGVAELVLGIGLLTPFSAWAAGGVILLLIAVFPVHIYMLTSDKFSRTPRWLLWLRLPLQLVLIAWAYSHVH